MGLQLSLRLTFHYLQFRSLFISLKQGWILCATLNGMKPTRVFMYYSCQLIKLTRYYSVFTLAQKSPLMLLGWCGAMLKDKIDLISLIVSHNSYLEPSYCTDLCVTLGHLSSTGEPVPAALYWSIPEKSSKLKVKMSLSIHSPWIYCPWAMSECAVSMTVCTVYVHVCVCLHVLNIDANFSSHGKEPTIFPFCSRYCLKPRIYYAPACMSWLKVCSIGNENIFKQPFRLSKSQQSLLLSSIHRRHAGTTKCLYCSTKKVLQLRAKGNELVFCFLFNYLFCIVIKTKMHTGPRLDFQLYKL